MIKVASAVLGGLLVFSLLGSVHAQEKNGEGGFSGESTSSSLKMEELGKITPKDTSRDKYYTWGTQTIPSSKGMFAQRVSNLRVSIIEQKGVGNGKITTLYAASGTFVNGSEDDKSHVPTYWNIAFLNSAGTTVDTYTFSLPHDHCSYSGEEPFSIAPSPSAFNFFDVIVGATSQGTKPAGYEGGC